MYLGGVKFFLFELVTDWGQILVPCIKLTLSYSLFLFAYEDGLFFSGITMSRKMSVY